MCANFQPITHAQAPLYTSNQLTFDFKDDIYPNYDSPLLFRNPVNRQIEWRQVRFGMIPKWAESIDITKYTYNARTETVMQKPSFKNAWYNSQFALVPLQTIYEPLYTGDKSQRFGIHRTDGEPFTVACIYEIARIDGEVGRSMSMLTINADNHPFMSQFHRPKDEKRSIVVIPPELRQAWLTCHVSHAHQFLQPMPDKFTAEYRPRNVTSNNSSAQSELF